MNTISKEYFLNTIEPLLKKIFVSNDDTKPFVNEIRERLLLYFPFVGGDEEKDYYLWKKLVESLAHANQKTGENGYYLVSDWQQYPSIPTPHYKNHYAYIPQDEFVEAIAFTPGSSKGVWSQLKMYHLNYCLCSTNGTWGLFRTSEDYGFLGGSLEFIQTVKNYFPEVENEVFRYLNQLRGEQISGEYINWLRQLLVHVYGQESAEELLKKTELI